jgi:hypothetical protein
VKLIVKYFLLEDVLFLTRSAVRIEGTLSSFFENKTGQTG